MAVSKYMPGIPENTDPEFIARLWAEDMMGILTSMFALFCRERSTKPEMFIAFWGSQSVQEKRIYLNRVWPGIDRDVAQHKIEKLINFTF